MADDKSPFPVPSVSWGYPLERTEKEAVQRGLREAERRREGSDDKPASPPADPEENGNGNG